MEFRTRVEIEKPSWQIAPAESMLFVGSCFADQIGQRFAEEEFPVTVNPYGVMYNPASILHTLQRLEEREERREGREYSQEKKTILEDVRGEKKSLSSFLFPLSSLSLVVLTLGTNHIYVEKDTGKIVDNCQKRPQSLFEERELTVNDCADYLKQSITLLRQWNPSMKVILTVSPIRYQKYGFHRSQLSKAVLLLAIDKLLADNSSLNASLYYFPAYEIVNDELRDYRFYNPDMMHPTAQAVEYIWQRLVETCFSDTAKRYLEEWQPLKRAIAHRPFNPDSSEYQQFLQKTQDQLKAFKTKWKVPFCS